MAVANSASTARKGTITLTDDIVALPNWRDCVSPVYPCDCDGTEHEHFVPAEQIAAYVTQRP